jgi:hypothetical protein
MDEEDGMHPTDDIRELGEYAPHKRFVKGRVMLFYEVKELPAGRVF